MSHDIRPSRTYAFEGINASGKSTAIADLSTKILEQDKTVGIYKISGIGTGHRMDRLRQILHHRETLLRDRQMSEKQQRDFSRDRLFRLATRIQIRTYLEADLSNVDVSLLDRTPLMSWAYSAAVNSENPYLDEILEEALQLTASLSIDTAFLFDIDPITAYARIVSRNCDPQEDLDSQVEHFVAFIPASSSARAKVTERTMEILLTSPPKTRKAFSIWDYMPYDEVCRQTETYTAALAIAHERIGLSTVRIDARKPIEDILGEITTHIQ